MRGRLYVGFELCLPPRVSLMVCFGRGHFPTELDQSQRTINEDIRTDAKKERKMAG